MSFADPLGPHRYSHLLQSLETEGLADKMRILKSFDEPAFEIKRLNLPTVRFNGLFETKKLVSFAHTATPKKVAVANATAATPTPATAKKLTPAQVHITPSAAKFAVGGTPATVKAVKMEQKENGSAKLRPMDPKKVSGFGVGDSFTRIVADLPTTTQSLSKQTPPPCNAHYLKGGCPKGAACQYAHDYALSAKMISILRSDAKKSPCAVRCYSSPCFEFGAES